MRAPALHDPVRQLRGESGQAMVEFAVTLPIFLLLMLGVIYFGRAYYMDQSVRHAARYAAWKAARHTDSSDSAYAESAAREYFLLPGATFAFEDQSATLDDIGLLTTDVFDGYGDPSGLPDGFNGIDVFVEPILTAGLAMVGTTYEARVTESWSAPWLPFLGTTRVERNHRVAYADWTKEEIAGDEIILAFEAYLDIWAYDNITNM